MYQPMTEEQLQWSIVPFFQRGRSCLYPSHLLCQEAGYFCLFGYSGALIPFQYTQSCLIFASTL